LGQTLIDLLHDPCLVDVDFGLFFSRGTPQEQDEKSEKSDETDSKDDDQRKLRKHGTTDPESMIDPGSKRDGRACRTKKNREGNGHEDAEKRKSENNSEKNKED
jgi:hypothetical protein